MFRIETEAQAVATFAALVAELDRTGDVDLSLGRREATPDRPRGTRLSEGEVGAARQPEEATAAA